MAPVVVVAVKESKEDKCGIGLKKYTPTSPIQISSINEEGVFASSDLEIGMQILSINNVSVKGKSKAEAGAMLRAAEGQVKVIAEQPSSTVALAFGSTTPPRGVPAGGQWGENTFVGNSTGMLACVGFLCFCIPGCLVLMCPIDKRDAYKVSGKVNILWMHDSYSSYSVCWFTCIMAWI
jgi:hypothetical protein